MKVLVSWLRDLVDVPVDPATLARDLHMTGFEVASVEPVGDGDAVIDFEITANRPDCLSLAGLAREVSTRYGTALHLPEAMDLGPADPGTQFPLHVAIEDPVRCPRYCAAVADVTVGPSPDWLAARLTAAGIRAISNVVDVTNYVLLELGHPMHAFDLARLAGPSLHARTAKPAETIQTLDGQTRKLDPEMLVIADQVRAQALGGVMGGVDSEVTAKTTRIALESAWFLPASVRRTARKLGVSTEASYRFERGADIDAAPRALARACRLLEQIAAGRVHPGWIDAYPSPRATRVIHLALGRVLQVLGAPVRAADVTRILTGLGFVATPDGADAWQVSVPSWRLDVARDVDLIEEVARHFGYDKLPTTFPALTSLPAKPSPRLQQDRTLRRLTSAAGFNECVTFSFISEKAATEFAPADALVPIANPLSETFAVLRPSLLPGLVDALGHNRRHGQREVRLFELGTRFVAGHGERRALALGWLGATAPEHWGTKPRNVDLFDLKGVAEMLGGALGLRLMSVADTRTHLVAGRTAVLQATDRDGTLRIFGVVGQLLPALATSRDIPAQDEVYVAELDLDAVADTSLRIPHVTTKPLPRNPSVVRDLSILVADTLPAGEVRDTIRAAAPPTLMRVAEFDRYQGKGIPDGHASLSYRLTFQAPNRTLTDADVDAAMNAIVAELARKCGAVRR